MEAIHLNNKCISFPIHSFSSSPHSTPVSSMVLIPVRKNRRLASSFRSIRRRNHCSASSSDTLVAGSRMENGKPGEAVRKKDEEVGDLKSWMHKNGLPPCKVLLKERSSHDERRPIHYVVASEELQAGDVDFSVPNSLVVTLERVLGNETIGEYRKSIFSFLWVGFTNHYQPRTYCSSFFFVEKASDGESFKQREKKREVTIGY